MVGDGSGNQSVQARMAWRRRHPHGGPVSSGSVVATSLLQRRRGAWEVVQERMQIVVCIDDIWKTERVLGSWFVDGRYGFLLQHLSRGGVPDLEFDGVFGVLPRSDSFNGKSFIFGKPL